MSAEQIIVSKTAPEVLRDAQYALKWNPPEFAAAIFANKREQITRIKKETEIGFPNAREARHALKTALEGMTRLRRLGLASGDERERSPGMIFALPQNTPRSEPTPLHPAPPTDIGDSGTSFELWYLPRAEIEGVFGPSQPRMDQYVSRAAREYIASQDGLVPLPYERIYQVHLDSGDALELINTAKYMKVNGLYGRIPSPTAIQTAEILHSGQFPGRNIRSYPSRSAISDVQKTKTA